MNDNTQENFPLTAAFLARYTLAVQVESRRSVNDGNPVVTGFIVDKTIDDPKAMLDARRPLVRISYREEGAESKPITFYGPDGEVAIELSEDLADSGTADSVVNPQINQLWGLEPDSRFAAKIGEAMVSTCSMLTAASLIANATGNRLMEVFDALQRASVDPDNVSVLDGSDGTLRDEAGNEVTSFAALRGEHKTEGAANEG